METRISTDVEEAAYHLSKGRVIAIPTETVYGLAADAMNVDAVEEIFRLKNRPFSDPLIVHVSTPEVLERYDIEVPLWAQRLISLFWPGPLTLLLPRGRKIPPLVTAELPRVAVRAPAHPLTQALLNLLPFPIAAPSANPFSHISPTTPLHVYRYFAGKIPFILDGGACPAGIESTIIGEEQGRFILYRPGALAREKIEEALGEKLYSRSAPSVRKPITPGQFPKHYAPKKPLLYGWNSPPVEPNASLILFSGSPQTSHPYTHVLSPEGDLETAASSLYATLHACEEEPTEYIIAQQVPLTGIGESLHDRLRRATSRSLFTIGHSHHSWAEFLSLLQRYEVQAIVDLRRQPHSRFVPHFSQGPLQKALHEHGITYEWQPVPARLLSTIERLLHRYLHIALLCAEGEPHRCHRFRLSDELSEKGFSLFHILPEGHLQLHRAPISLRLSEKD
ncbi:MAG: L-threonylcarbamoyladenylate synthase [Bacteroidia bacterium]|nr:L-threonylcarbamoyladenylate synthase [Bacteroidia bacterium]